VRDDLISGGKDKGTRGRWDSCVSQRVHSTPTTLDGTAGFPAQNLGTVRDSIYPLQMSEEFVVTTPQPVYVLPRDHKFHGGEFYSQNGE
jgi:hypothetical protein